MKKRVLLTGAAGFIGSHLLEALLEQGHYVHACDNLRAGQIEFIRPTLKKHAQNSKFIIESFANKMQLHEVSQGAYDVIVHLAAIPRIGYSIEHPIETHQTNVTDTLNLLEAARHGKAKFVFASSSSIYGDRCGMLQEDMEVDIRSPYAHQKHTIETYLKLYSSLYGMNTVALRYFSVFGPRSLGTSSYATVIGSWLTSIKSGDPIRIQGTGEQTRDFCYIDNVVDATLRAVNYKYELKGDVFNVSCGESTSLLNIMQALKERYTFEVKNEPERQADIWSTCGDIDKSYHILGYYPNVKIFQGLQRTMDWYDENWESIKELGK